MEKQNTIVRFLTNIYVKNILLMIAISVVLVFFILFVLNIYTRHNQSVIVPPVKGLQVQEAAGILKSADLEYEVVDSVYHEGAVPGAILDQIPKEKTNVKSGRTVFLTVQAIGVQMISIPELKDYSRRQAEAQLNSLGFNNVIIEEVPSAYAGIVISVSYKGASLSPSQKVPKGATLKMTVGAGGEIVNDSIDETDVSEIDESFQ